MKNTLLQCFENSWYQILTLKIGCFIKKKSMKNWLWLDLDDTIQNLTDKNK